jgi:hypothetical protein
MSAIHKVALHLSSSAYVSLAIPTSTIPTHHKDITRIRHHPSSPQELFHIPKLPMDVAGDGDRRPDGLDVALLDEDLAYAGAEELHFALGEVFAFEQLRDPPVGGCKLNSHCKLNNRMVECGKDENVARMMQPSRPDERTRTTPSNVISSPAHLHSTPTSRRRPKVMLIA